MRGAVYCLTRQIIEADELYIDLSNIAYAYLNANYTIFFNNPIMYRCFTNSVSIFPYRCKIKSYIDYSSNDMSFLDFLGSLRDVKYFEIRFELRIFGDREYLLKLFDHLKTLYTDDIYWTDCSAKILLSVKSKPITVPIRKFF